MFYRIGHWQGISAPDISIKYHQTNRSNRHNQNKKIKSWANPIKLFKAAICGFSLKARVFVPGKPFQPSLMFVV
jgi:hypothetical protein